MPLHQDGSVTFTAQEFALFKQSMAMMLFAAGSRPETSLESAEESVTSVVDSIFENSQSTGLAQFAN